MLDLAIIGGGPAGLSAAIYAARGGTKEVVMFEPGMPGGQITQSSEIENYPGQTGAVSGIDLMESWTPQAIGFGAKHQMSEIARVTKGSDGIFKLTTTSGEEYSAVSVVVCTGSVPKPAGFDGEKEFLGRGVSTCATCDGFFYRGKEVAVIGGGDTAVEEAIYLAQTCSKVYVIHRRDSFRAPPAMVDRLKALGNVELILKAKPKEVYGDAMGVTGLKVELSDGSIRDLAVPGVFVFVGRNVKNSVLLQSDGKFLCATNESGEVVVNLKMHTDVEGLFCAGDMRIDAPKQVVSAASDGAIAALEAMAYIGEFKSKSK